MKFLIEKENKNVCMTSDKGFGDFDTSKFEVKEVKITSQQKQDIETNKFDLKIKRNKLVFEKKISTIQEEKLKTKENVVLDLKERSKKTMTETEQKKFNEDLISIINQ